MKARALDFVPCLFAAAGLALFVFVFVSETSAFRAAVAGWAERDLAVRTELAARTLSEPLAVADFRRIRAFGDECAKDGVRLTVYSAPGGVVFDSLSRGAPPPDDLYAAAPAGEFKVRLGIPRERVFAPFVRARPGLILSALVGAFGVLLVFLFTWRVRSRVRVLAAERDAERRRADELRRAEEYRRAFVADVSHEIKTPLTGILGAVDMLDSPSEPPPEMRRELLAMLRRESKRIDSLAQGVLDLARLDRADDALRAEPTDLRPLLDSVADHFAAQAQSAGVKMAVRQGGPCVAVCDAALVERAVMNLVSNALRHSGSPTVELALERRGGAAAIVVEDAGRGVPPEHREKIFERFHRVDASRAETSGGAGLGLAIVRRAARLHGGDCVLESPPGGGARFVFTLPLS